MLRLTEEQAAIVKHQKGPALVFAVAGAGKTTAMVHRIASLVEQNVFPARTILATSFSKAAVDDIRKALSQWSFCREVQSITLHALGYRIIQRAREKGYLRSSGAGMRDNIEYVILNQTLSMARKRKVPFKRELDSFDRDDFLSYVSACKGNLKYADLEASDLPLEGLGVASQAEEPFEIPWYLDLYKLFEEVRKGRNEITFGDMLMTGWELLVRHEELLMEFQRRYRSILVDEFQDVNLAQSEILDLLARPHKNYMVIGDDDQTIYEWRGATPKFILGFEERYKAAKFIIQDNFRCKASHLVLANHIISHNDNREPKFLSLTQDFSGGTYVHEENDNWDMAESLVNKIQNALGHGTKPSDIVILVRLYAQTPYVEHYLIERGIPYRIEGSVPFYKRPEIQVLLHYLRVVQMTGNMGGTEPIDDRIIPHIGKMWRQICNRPTRYITGELAEKILATSVSYNLPLHRSVLLSSSELRSWQAQHMYDLADVLKWLSEVMDTMSGHLILEALENRLGYTDYLMRSSGFPETGQGRVANVKAFIEYAKGKGNGVQLLEHIERITFQQSGRPLPKEACITLMTIYRAKGLEWPIVMLPNCNDGTMPFRGNFKNLEEERRLLYVAVTRTKRELHLFTPRKKSLSRFLKEAEHMETLEKIELTKRLLERKPEEWSARDILDLVRNVDTLRLGRYLTFWWQAPDQYKRAAAQMVQRFLKSAEQRKLSQALGLKMEYVELWQQYGPLEQEPTDNDFPELEKLARTVKLEAPKKASPAKQESKFDEIEPDLYFPGLKVKHPQFGMGVVKDVVQINQNLRLTVEFESEGTIKIAPHFTNLERFPTESVEPEANAQSGNHQVSAS